jgi:hypothetical protein
MEKCPEHQPEKHLEQKRPEPELRLDLELEWGFP